MGHSQHRPTGLFGCLGVLRVTQVLPWQRQGCGIGLGARGAAQGAIAEEEVRADAVPEPQWEALD